MNLICERVNYQNSEQTEALLTLLDKYACDPMGGASPLTETCKQKLIPGLQNTATAISILCYKGSHAIGLINAFEGFSTFSAAPLINLHDVYIAPNFRGQGVLEFMFSEIEKIAQERGCCKVTLEVLSNNKVAQSAYKKLGFAGYELLEEAGEAVFWQKKLK